MKEKKYWFKAKTYGWGWTPSSWQGWLIMIIFCALIAGIVLWADQGPHSASDTFIKAAPALITTLIILLAIAVVKGERPHWRWGPNT